MSKTKGWIAGVLLGGLLAAMLAGFVLSMTGIGPLWEVMILGALVAAGVELIPLPVNDNLVIPVVSGGVMELALRLTM